MNWTLGKVCLCIFLAGLVGAWLWSQSQCQGEGDQRTPISSVGIGTANSIMDEKCTGDSCEALSKDKESKSEENCDLRERRMYMQMYATQGFYVPDPYSLYTNYYKLSNLASIYLGASIASIRDTVPFIPPNSNCGPEGCTNLVETILVPEIILPGKNWKIKGDKGSVVIELAEPAGITGFTLIHPTKQSLPLKQYFTSAPKDFEVFGLKRLDDPDPILFGKYKYLDDADLGSAQTFIVENPQLSCKSNHKLIEVKFLSNHGNPAYTSIYKFEVHGVLVSVLREEEPKQSLGWFGF